MRVIILALLAAASLSAATPQKLAKIEKLFTILHVEHIQDEIWAALTARVDQTAMQVAQQAGYPVEQRAAATKDLHEKMLASMKDLTSWQRLKPGMIEIYDAEFSDAELDSILAFFSSPTGQSFLTKSGEITDKSRVMADTHVKEAGQAVQALAKDWLAEQATPKPTAK